MYIQAICNKNKNNSPEYRLNDRCGRLIREVHAALRSTNPMGRGVFIRET